MEKQLNFWAKELAITDLLCQLKAENKSHKLWGVFNHNSLVNSRLLLLNNGVFSYLELAVSIVFIGQEPNELFVNQHGFIAKKLKETEKELANTLGMPPTKELILDDLFRSWTEEQWQRFDDLSYQQPFLYTLSQTTAAWEQDGRILFLFTKRDDEQKQKQYTICLGGLDSKQYHEILGLLG